MVIIVTANIFIQIYLKIQFKKFFIGAKKIFKEWFMLFSNIKTLIFYQMVVSDLAVVATIGKVQELYKN
jgi:hypothetical protein